MFVSNIPIVSGKRRKYSSSVNTVLKFSSFFVQGQRDQSVTFGFREGLSTLDIRQSTNEDLETIRREVYVRRPSSRTSTNSGEETTPPGN